MIVRSLIGFIGLMLIGVCNSTKPVERLPLYNLELIKNEIPGWSPSTDSTQLTVEGDTTKLYTSIDGGAILYNTSGMKNYFIQFMKKDTNTAQCMVMDFGTEQAATAMFNAKKAVLDTSIQLGSYSLTSAVVADGLSSITLFAHINKYYFELIFLNYDNSTQPNSDASQFFAKYLTKLN